MRLRQRAGNLETTGAVTEKRYVQSPAQRCGATKPIDAARSLQFALLNFETAITKNEPAPKAIDVQRSATNRKRHMWKDAVVRIEVQRPCRGRKQFGSIQDRKSTRLNSSHEWISYAVFCLKKKNKQHLPGKRK